MVNNKRPTQSKQEALEKKFLRYCKTVQWMNGKSGEEIKKCAETKIMENYPVDAKTIEDAIRDLDSEQNLRSTGISLTDLRAIEDVVKEWKKIEQTQEQK